MWKYNPNDQSIAIEYVCLSLQIVYKYCQTWKELSILFHKSNDENYKLAIQTLTRNVKETNIDC